MSSATRAFASAEKIIIATKLAQIEKHFRIVDVQTKFFLLAKTQDAAPTSIGAFYNIKKAVSTGLG
jgi:hypothetical protein